jgi:hypothetical protein
MKILGILATLIGLAMGISCAAASSAETNGEIKLVTTLDEPRGYCVDMTGSKQSAQTNRPLQTHTCYGYQDSIAVDQGVSSADVSKGALRFPYFKVCIIGTGVQAGSPVTLGSCLNGNTKAVVWNANGQINPVASHTLCLTAGTSTQNGGGGSPVHLKRSLSWENCASNSETRQAWKLPTLTEN